MSSYLVFNLNGVDVLCVARSSHLYSHCEHAPYEEPKDVTVDDLRIALNNAQKYSKDMIKRKKELEFVLEHTTLTRYEIEEIFDEIEYTEDEIERNSKAISIIEVLMMMLEENNYKEKEESKVVLTWVVC